MPARVQQSETQKAEPWVQWGVSFCTVFALLSPTYGNIVWMGSLHYRVLRNAMHTHIARLSSFVVRFSPHSLGVGGVALPQFLLCTVAQIYLFLAETLVIKSTQYQLLSSLSLHYWGWKSQPSLSSYSRLLANSCRQKWVGGIWKSIYFSWEENDYYWHNQHHLSLFFF